MSDKTTLVSAGHAFGYWDPDKIANTEIPAQPQGSTFNQAEFVGRIRNFMWFHDICNVVSIVASPIIGIIRLIAGIYLLNQINKINHRETKIDLEAAKGFAVTQISRGCLEILCAGPLLAIFVDTLFTCFICYVEKQAQEEIAMKQQRN